MLSYKTVLFLLQCTVTVYCAAVCDKKRCLNCCTLHYWNVFYNCIVLLKIYTIAGTQIIKALLSTIGDDIHSQAILQYTPCYYTALYYITPPVCLTRYSASFRTYIYNMAATIKSWDIIRYKSGPSSDRVI